MKAQKIFNILLLILIIILISLISFIGIFYQDKNEMVSKTKDYTLGTDLKGYRSIVMKLKDESSSDSNNTTNTDNSTTENETENETSNNTTNEVSNDDSNKNKDNYKKCAEIVSNRLKNLKVEDYSVSYNGDSGDIEIKIPDNDKTDIILSDITQKGNFKIQDEETKETLLSNNDIKNAEISEKTTGNNTTLALTINFTFDGTKKFQKVTEKYQNKTNEATTNNSTNTENESNTINVTDETNTANDANATNETTDSSTSSDDKSGKKVALVIDDTTLMTTNFDEIIDSGKLSLTVGSSTSETPLVDQRYGAENLAVIIENDAMPLQYEIKTNIFIHSPIDSSKIQFIVFIEIGIALVILLYFVIRFRLNGILSIFTSVGYVAILLLAIRETNVILSIEGILGIELAFILHCVFVNLLLSKLKEKDLTNKEKDNILTETIKKYILVEIPIAIFATVCVMITSWNGLVSLGTLLIWAIIVSTIYDPIISLYIIRSTRTK